MPISGVYFRIHVTVPVWRIWSRATKNTVWYKLVSVHVELYGKHMTTHAELEKWYACLAFSFGNATEAVELQVLGGAVALVGL